jgi:predicted dehydrogenase
VFVVTPHHWHAIMAIMGINAGKNVYCEKPVSKTIREAVSLAAAARKTKKVVQAGTQARTSPLQAYAVKQIQSGAIGDVKKVLVGCFGQPNRSDVVAEPTPPYLDWEMFVGPAPMCAYSKLRWSFRKELSGGIIIDWGQHFFDVAQWGLGMDHTGPVEVLPAGYQDHEFVTLRYANGAEIMLHAKDGKALSEGTTFIGTKGKIFIHAWNDEVTFEPAELGAAYYKEAKLDQPKAITGIWNNALSDKHVASFFDCVRNGKKTNAPIENAHRSVTLGHLVNISLWTMRPLKWNPDQFEFVDDREANAYLHIPPREPWKV